ncbi:MAG: hypothetical protein SFY96_14400 [Planctomycetota bacterium]|nr:hypothetical protein [Planctomycetota bacterium]
MSTRSPNHESSDARVADALPKRSFAQLFFRTSIFEIIAMRGRRELAATRGLETLPMRVRELVMRVVRKARLWRHERTDVAAELASHFREGLARGESEDTLIRGFGDERVAARLIRRGMRRKRPLAWKLWFYWSRGSVVLLGVLIATYVFLYCRAWLDTPSINRNYSAEWNAAAMAVPEADRAAPLYIQANRAIAATPGLKDGERFMVERDPNERGYSVSKAFLEANPKLLELIRAATAKPKMGLIVSDADPLPDWAVGQFDDAANATRVSQKATENPPLITVLLPHLGPMRQMARFLAQDAAFALHEGDSARMVDNWAAMLRLARHASEDQTLIGQLVGVAVMFMVFDDVVRVMQSHPDLLDSDALRRVAHLLAAASLREQPGDLTLNMSREHDMIEDTLQRVFTDNGRGDGRLAPRGLAAMGEYMVPGWAKDANETFGVTSQNAAVGPAAPAAVVISASRRETSDAYRELLGAFDAERRVPLWDRTARNQLADVSAKYDNGVGRTRYFILGALWPAFGRMVEVERGVGMKRDVAVTCVALAGYRARHGAWPAALDELVPSYLPRVPLDPFDGKPLRYRLKDGKPLLYSIGADLEDNGGVAPTKQIDLEELQRMARAWIVTKKGAAGFDAVYWPTPGFPKPSPSLE